MKQLLQNESLPVFDRQKQMEEIKELVWNEGKKKPIRCISHQSNSSFLKTALSLLGVRLHFSHGIFFSSESCWRGVHGRILSQEENKVRANMWMSGCGVFTLL